jgi:hypothetical protein
MEVSYTSRSIGQLPVCQSTLGMALDWITMGFSMNFWSLHQAAFLLERSTGQIHALALLVSRITNLLQNLFATPLKQTWVLRRSCQPCKPVAHARTQPRNNFQNPKGFPGPNQISPTFLVCGSRLKRACDSFTTVCASPAAGKHTDSLKA